jgi:tetratricopeptide (TPR) repeat protein
VADASATPVPAVTDPGVPEALIVEARALEESAGKLLGREAADALVRAAELRHRALGETEAALGLLRRALQAEGSYRPAINRLAELSAQLERWSELVDVLDVAARAAVNDDERAMVLAQRGDVLGRRLGRLAEARSMYREVARLAPDPKLKEAAVEAVEQLDAILTGAGTAPATGGSAVKRPYFARERTGVVRMPTRPAIPVAPRKSSERQTLLAEGKIDELIDALIRDAESASSPAQAQALLREAAQRAGQAGQTDRAIELFTRGLAFDPSDEQTLAEAVSFGVAQGILDVGRRLLPDLSPEQRGERLERLAQGALVLGDHKAAVDYRAVAFQDRPDDIAAFEARVKVLEARHEHPKIQGALEDRLAVITDPTERRATLWELAARREAAERPRDAIEFLLASIEVAQRDEDVEDALTSIDRLSKLALDRRLLARAYERAAAREGPRERRAARWVRLAELRRDELSDLEGAEEAYRAALALGRDEVEGEVAALEEALLFAAALSSPAEAALNDPSVPARLGEGRPEPPGVSEPPGLLPPAVTEVALGVASSEPPGPVGVFATPSDPPPEDRSQWPTAGRGLTAISTPDLPRWAEASASRRLRPPFEAPELEGQLPLSFDGLRSDEPTDKTLAVRMEPEGARPPSEPPQMPPVGKIDAPPGSVPPRFTGGGTQIDGPTDVQRFPVDAQTVRARIRTTETPAVEMEATARLEKGDLDGALDVLSASVGSMPGASAATWTAVGRRALDLGRDEEAELCFVLAVGSTEDLATKRAIFDLIADGCVRSGKMYEAAIALASKIDPEIGPRARSERCQEVARRFLSAGADWLAESWLESAVDLCPVDPRPAHALLERYASRGERQAIELLVARFDLSAVPGVDACSWSTALSRVRRSFKDYDRAAAELENALRADPRSLEPARELLDLATSLERDDWIDRALEQIRSRAMQQGARARAFAAAAVRVARGDASEGERLTYSTLRLEVSGSPKQGAPTVQIEEWLAACSNVRHSEEARVAVDESGEQRAVPEVNLEEPFQPEPPILEAIASAREVFGVPSALELRRLPPGAPPLLAAPGPSLALGIAPSFGGALSPAELRFQIGRAVAATLDDRLARALRAASANSDAHQVGVLVLDRAGLLLSADPRVALDAVGPRTARGRALTEFALSDEILERWAELGLGPGR